MDLVWFTAELKLSAHKSSQEMKIASRHQEAYELLVPTQRGELWAFQSPQESTCVRTPRWSLSTGTQQEPGLRERLRLTSVPPESHDSAASHHSGPGC